MSSFSWRYISSKTIVASTNRFLYISTAILYIVSYYDRHFSTILASISIALSSLDSPYHFVLSMLLFEIAINIPIKSQES
jgi:hypothetical protein